MRTETVTDFLEQYEHVYDLGDISWIYDDLFVYMNKFTGRFEVFDRDLDYQETVFPWVSLTGYPLRVAYPNILPVSEQSPEEQRRFTIMPAVRES